MRKFAAFVRLSRPQFLLGGFAAFGLGAAVAAFEGIALAPLRYAAGQLMITAFHLMTHYANEYFDRDGDGAAATSRFSGGSGAIASGALAPRVALYAATACAAAGGAIAVAFLCGGMGVAGALGIATGAGAWIYSAPPVRLAARGWGELDTAAVVAVLVPLTGYATFAGAIDQHVLTATLAPACAMFAMMIAVEWPDRDADAAAGKQNLVVRYGPAAARFAAGGALAIVPALAVAGASGNPWLCLAFGLVLLPPIVRFVQRIGFAPAAEIAGRGVALFGLTLTAEIAGYAGSVTIWR